MTKTATLPMDSIKESEDNPRRTFNQAKLEELAASIAEIGVLQPILVRPRPRARKYKYEVVCGARRLRAAKLAGMTEIPAIVRDMGDLVAAHARVVENNHREDVPPSEEARAIGALRDLGETVEDLAVGVGRTVAWVRSRLDLLLLPDDVLEAVDAGTVRLSAAVILASRAAPEMREQLIEIMRRQGLERAWTAGDVKSYMTSWERRLNNSKWDLDDAGLEPVGAGACSSCPHRTSRQVDLFSDVTDDQCINAGCWDVRKVAWLDAQEAAVTVRGGMIYNKTPKDTFSGCIGPAGNFVSVEEAEALCEGQCHDLIKQSWGIQKIWRKDVMAAELDAAGHGELAELIRKKRDGTAAKDRAAAKAQKAKEDALMESIATAAEKGWSATLEYAFLLCLVQAANQDPIIRLLKRRKVEVLTTDDNGYKRKRYDLAVAHLISDSTPSQRTGILVELVALMSDHHGYNEANKSAQDYLLRILGLPVGD